MDDRPVTPSRALAPPRPGQMTRRLGAATLLAQAMSVFFGGLVAWQLTLAAREESGSTHLWVLAGLALLCLLTAGALRTRAGILLGWVCQVLTLATALILPAMALVGLLFGVLWWLSVRYGGRIDADRARWADDDPGDHPAQTPTGGES